MQKKSFLSPMLAAVIMVLLSACSGGIDQEKVKMAINAGMSKNASCIVLPIGILGSKADVEKSGPIFKLLLDSGQITRGSFQQPLMFGGTREYEGYVFTDDGKKLIQRAMENKGAFTIMPCVRAGVYQVKSIEAVELGVDAEGQSVANARVKIAFKPEEWITKNLKSAEETQFLKRARENEAAQWMYSLKKSGAEYFFTKDGTKL